MKLKHLLIMGASILAVSCNNDGGFKKTEDNIEYKIHTPSKGDRIKSGDSVSFKVTIKPDNGDEAVYSSEKNGKDESIVMQEDLLKDNEIMKGLTLLTAGDSATFRIPIEAMIKNMPVDPFLRNYIRKDGKVIYDITITKVVLKEQLEKEQKEKADKQNAIDNPLIDKYVSSKKLDLQTLPSGIRYKMIKPGVGETAVVGDTVKLHYKGSLLSGKVFDSSYDRKSPISFPVVKGQTVPGFFEALQLLKKGSKAIVAMPSTLGYGADANGVIPANSPLVFEIEVLDIIHPKKEDPKESKDKKTEPAEKQKPDTNTSK
ncbi:MAG: FKBP-type peptidyl-prolyl cis-trans isomerase [Solitalea-like symbiont of Acarus siro]